MTVHAYTSFSFAYLDRARVFAETLRRQHPDWIIWAVIVDKEPEGFYFELANENFDRVIWAEDLFGPSASSWIFEHDIVEACTAVKGRALQHIMDEPDAEKIIYFDPDTGIFNSMDPVIELLDNHSIVLTPHQIDPEPATAKRAIQDNEITSLSHGIFNLGFIAVSNVPEARKFAGWWAERLQDWCHDRLDIGVFVDQKWCDLIPCFFDNVKVLRDPGYNVASWNLSQRKMHFSSEGVALINGVPLRFFHFTKLGKLGDMMTERYALGNVEIYELWWWYRQEVLKNRDSRIPQGWWFYRTFDNGVPIPRDGRLLYRDRQDLRDTFMFPLKVDDGYFHWLVTNGYVADQ